MNKRDEIQSQIKTEVIASGFHGIIYASPRVGKTKPVVEALAQVPSGSKVLITYPYNPIKDAWISELNQWGNKDKLSGLQIEFCNRVSLGKLGDQKFDLIICDEIHELNEHQIIQIKKLSKERVLGLTGSLTKNITINLFVKLNLKIIYEYTISDAISDSIVADYEIHLVGIDLESETKIIEAGRKDNRFLTTERKAYDYWTKKFNQMRFAARKDPKKTTIKMMFANKRANFLYTAPLKIVATKKIISEHIDPSERCLIFTTRKAVADELCENRYYSGSPFYKDPNGEFILSLDAFAKGHIDRLAVVQMVSMGVTIPNLKVGVFHQLQSSETDAVQKFMRMCNAEDGKKAKIWILYYRGTKDEEWVKKAVSQFDESKFHFYRM